MPDLRVTDATDVALSVLSGVDVQHVTAERAHAVEGSNLRPVDSQLLERREGTHDSNVPQATARRRS